MLRDLACHPKTPARGVQRVACQLSWADDALAVRYIVEHDAMLEIPTRRGRQDGLWTSTCFELFVRDGAGPGYVEFNLAPADAWAAYTFCGEREGMHSRGMTVPAIGVSASPGEFSLEATFAPDALPDELGPAGLSAVIEEHSGVKSYWALSHPNADRPDFHDPRCFVLNLSPPPAG